MHERLQPTLLLLDQGLALYRKHFVAFALIAASWFVPLAIIVGLLIVSGDLIGEFGVIAVILVSIVVFAVLMIYLIVALSRAATVALDGREMRVREIMRFEPLRIAGMAIFAIVYMVVAQIMSSLISFVCICPAYILGIGAIAGTSIFAGSLGATAGGLAFVVIFGFIYIFAIFLSGAIYSGLIYGLQPWAQDRLGFGKSLELSVDALVNRFWRNLVTWGFAGLLLAALTVTLALAIGTLIPLPLGFLIGFDTPVVQAVTAGAWLFGLVFVLPPLPIWMALLYRNNRSAREGWELQTKVNAWMLRTGTIDNVAG